MKSNAANPDYRQMYEQCKQNVSLFMAQVQQEIQTILRTHHAQKNVLLTKVALLQRQLADKQSKNECRTIVSNLSEGTNTRSHSQKPFCQEFDSFNQADLPSLTKQFTKIHIDSSNQLKSMTTSREILKGKESNPREYLMRENGERVSRRSVNQPKHVWDMKNILKSMRHHMANETVATASGDKQNLYGMEHNRYTIGRARLGKV